MEYFDILPFVLILSAILTGSIMTFSKKTGLFIDSTSKSHGIHKIDTPRSGGIAIFMAGAFMTINPMGLLLYISSIPIFLIGFFEDLVRDISPKVRLIIMALSGLLGMILLGAIVYDIEYIHFPFTVAILFTVFGVVGVINAFNLIDGLNGLASGMAICTFLSIAFVSYIYNDIDLLTVSLILAVATAGFILFNFPKGFIFLGDTGAYFLGFMIAELSILLVNRHPEVSAWFPFVLLIYPIWETVFSILRRKFIEKKSAFSPDKNHLHCVLCHRLNSNPFSSAFILTGIAFIDLFAVAFRERTDILTIIAFSFIVIYTFVYILVRLDAEKVIQFRKSFDRVTKNYRYR